MDNVDRSWIPMLVIDINFDVGWWQTNWFFRISPFSHGTCLLFGPLKEFINITINVHQNALSTLDYEGVTRTPWIKTSLHVWDKLLMRFSGVSGLVDWSNWSGWVEDFAKDFRRRFPKWNPNCALCRDRGGIFQKRSHITITVEERGWWRVSLGLVRIEGSKVKEGPDEVGLAFFSSILPLIGISWDFLMVYEEIYDEICIRKSDTPRKLQLQSIDWAKLERVQIEIRSKFHLLDRRILAFPHVQDLPPCIKRSFRWFG